MDDRLDTSPTISRGSKTGKATDQKYSNIVYEKVLGSGSYKTVYQVSTVPHGDEPRHCFALAVQRLKEKSDVQDGLGGIHVAEELQQQVSAEDGQCFEEIVDWWFQTSPPLAFQEGAPVLSATSLGEHTRKTPHRFLGTKWLLALKPLYEMDLRKFCQRAPSMYPVGDDMSGPNVANESIRVLAGVPLTDKGALSLARDMLHAGKVMHVNDLVHRDIKPKNIMLRHGRPVVIDFGFADFVDKRQRNGKVCIEQPGRVKGEVDYVLSPDVARFQGCQEGDAYALGKTLYEVLYTPTQTGSTPAPSGKEEITVSAAQERNERFRTSINSSDRAGLQSRFRLSKSISDILLSAIRGLCRPDNPLSCAEAEQIIMDKFSVV